MSDPLPIVDSCQLPPDVQALLQPDALVTAPDGRQHRLPRFFYEIASWSQAKEWKLTAHFTLAELMVVDCREHPRLLRHFPHYVPCGIAVLARYLEEFRSRVEGPVMVAVNGGYRSPAHTASAAGSPHGWGVAADIYRIGDTRLETARAIERFGKVAAGIGPELRVRPFGHGPGETDDHLHLDLGFLRLTPAGWDEA